MANLRLFGLCALLCLAKTSSSHGAEQPNESQIPATTAAQSEDAKEEGQTLAVVSPDTLQELKDRLQSVEQRTAELDDIYADLFGKEAVARQNAKAAQTKAEAAIDEKEQDGYLAEAERQLAVARWYRQRSRSVFLSYEQNRQAVARLQQSVAWLTAVVAKQAADRRQVIGGLDRQVRMANWLKSWDFRTFSQTISSLRGMFVTHDEFPDKVREIVRDEMRKGKLGETPAESIPPTSPVDGIGNVPTPSFMPLQPVDSSVPHMPIPRLQASGTTPVSSEPAEPSSQNDDPNLPLLLLAIGMSGGTVMLATILRPGPRSETYLLGPSLWRFFHHPAARWTTALAMVMMLIAMAYRIFN